MLRRQKRPRKKAGALAAWLNARAVLGRDVFVASMPSAQPHVETSLAAFLVASLVAFEDRARSAADLPLWRLLPFDFPYLASAREQVLRLLEKAVRVPRCQSLQFWRGCLRVKTGTQHI